MSKHATVDQYIDSMPESKLELIDGQLIVGNSLAGSRYLLQDILEGWGVEAALPFADESVWKAALRTGFRSLQPPEPAKPLSTFEAWANHVSFETHLPPAGPQFEWGHYEARNRLRMELFRITEMGGFGRSLGGDCVIRLGDNAFTPDVFLIAPSQLDRSFDYYFDGAPALVIEVTMPGHEAQDRQIKRAYYAAAGVPEYWVVDPVARTIDMLMLAGNNYELRPAESDGRYHPSSVPGLAFVPGRLWEETDHPNRYPELFVLEVPRPTAKERNFKTGLGWGHLPFQPRPDLQPRDIRFEEFISWCGRAKFERTDDRPIIGGTRGTRNVLGMLLRTFGLAEAVSLIHPRRWVEGLLKMAENRRQDSHSKAEWWNLARKAGNLLRNKYGVGRLAVIGDLTKPEPLNLWSELDMVTWDFPKGIPYEVHQELFKLSGELSLEVLRADRATDAQRQEIEETAVEL